MSKVMQMNVEPEDLKPGDVVVQVTGEDDYRLLRITVEREVQELTRDDLDLITEAVQRARKFAVHAWLMNRYGSVTDIMVSNVIDTLEDREMPRLAATLAAKPEWDDSHE